MALRRAQGLVGLIIVVAAAWWAEAIVRPRAADDRIHVTYWEKWTGFEADAMRATVDAFNASQPSINVDLLTVSGIQNKTLLAVAGGNPPDVAGLFGPNVAQYADDNAVLPLDNYCRRARLTRDLYVPVYWDIGAYRGHQYALPSVPASTALHYNRAMRARAGLDPDRPPRTIEDLDADAATMTRTDSHGKIVVSGFLPSEPGWWNWGWGYVFGGQLWDGGARITANSPENVRAFTWVQSYSKRYGGTNLQSFKSGLGNFSSPQNGFLDGRVGMVLQGVWMYNFISKYAPEMETPVRQWGAAPFPHPADRPDLAGVTFADEDVLVIPRGARHPDEAFEFIRFVQSRRGMELLCMGQRKHSPLRRVSPGFYRRHPNPFIRLFAELPTGPNTVTPPKLGIWPEYQDALTNAFDEITLERKTPRQALDAVQARMQPKLDEYLRTRRLRAEAGR
ncbi:MAG: ABC transporter substrate-binding protein [Chthonomonadales bacterium]|nr:ABC transporter substrate-binding protein [Chthonomonadales bacterium]